MYLRSVSKSPGDIYEGACEQRVTQTISGTFFIGVRKRNRTIKSFSIIYNILGTPLTSTLLN